MRRPRGSPNDKEPANNGGLFMFGWRSVSLHHPVSRFVTGGFRRSGNPLTKVEKSTLADFKGQNPAALLTSPLI